MSPVLPACMYILLWCKTDIKWLVCLPVQGLSAATGLARLKLSGNCVLTTSDMEVLASLGRIEELVAKDGCSVCLKACTSLLPRILVECSCIC